MSVNHNRRRPGQRTVRDVSDQRGVSGSPPGSQVVMGNLADRVGPKKRFVREANSLQKHLLSDSGDVSDGRGKQRLLVMLEKTNCLEVRRAADQSSAEGICVV